MFDILQLVLGGGATGILGTLISRGVGLFQKRQDLTHELALRELDLRHIAAEAEVGATLRAHELESDRIEAAARERTAEHDALLTSIKADRAAYATHGLTPAQNWLMVIVDFVRGLMRPALTVALVALAWTIVVRTPTGSDPGAAGMVILYLAISCVTWWFCDRAAAKMAQAFLPGSKGTA